MKKNNLLLCVLLFIVIILLFALCLFNSNVDSVSTLRLTMPSD